MKYVPAIVVVLAVLFTLTSDGLAQRNLGNQAGPKQGAPGNGAQRQQQAGGNREMGRPANGQNGQARLRPNGQPNELRPGRLNADVLLAQFDRNGDGVISADEVPANGRRQQAQIDTNGDGGCDRSELEVALQQAQSAGQRGPGNQPHGFGQNGSDMPMQGQRRPGQHGMGQQSARGQRGFSQANGGQRQRGGGGGPGPGRGGGGGQRGGGR